MLAKNATLNFLKIKIKIHRFASWRNFLNHTIKFFNQEFWDVYTPKN
jgi:hypothetical protein